MPRTWGCHPLVGGQRKAPALTVTITRQKVETYSSESHSPGIPRSSHWQMPRLMRDASWFTVVSSCCVLMCRRGTINSGIEFGGDALITPQIRAMSFLLPLKLKLQPCWRQSIGSVLQKLGKFNFLSLFFIPNPNATVSLTGSCHPLCI